MDKEKLEKLREKAKQSLKILDLVENGATAQEIVARLGVNRQLADYYINTVSNG